jgi:hypothetical protein
VVLCKGCHTALDRFQWRVKDDYTVDFAADLLEQSPFCELHAAALSSGTPITL